MTLDELDAKLTRTILILVPFFVLFVLLTGLNFCCWCFNGKKSERRAERAAVRAEATALKVTRVLKELTRANLERVNRENSSKTPLLTKEWTVDKPTGDEISVESTRDLTSGESAVAIED